MRRFAILFGAALVGFAILPSLAQAQVVVQIGRPYAPPVIVTQPSYYVVPSYYSAPPVTTYSSSASYSYYPPTTVYSAPPPVVTYSASPLITYAAPATVLVPSGVVETRTYYGLGIFRPRGVYTQTRYYP